MAHNHSESLFFLLCNAPLNPIVLGLPSLTTNDPHISWRSGKFYPGEGIVRSIAFRSALRSPAHLHPLPPRSCSKVPSCYHNLCDIFNKARATTLPSHGDYNCAIDILSGTVPPMGWLYSLSVPEREAMDQYITSLLAADIVCSLWKRRTKPLH